MITFSEALERFSDGIVEGMRGVLVAMASRTQSAAPPSAVQHDVHQPRSTHTWVVAVGSVEAPGDGRWYLRQAATYTTHGGLNVSRELWPRPSSNLGLRTVRIACIKKPMVFEFQDRGGGRKGLDEAGGYIVEVMRVVQQHLNFTAVLVATQGFGLLMDNGSWNGMVGVLQRREADMAALDFTPSWRRAQVVDFSRAIGEDAVVIISRAPAPVVKPFLLMQIFTPLVWACLVGVALSMGVVLGLVWWTETHLFDHLAARGQVKGHIIQQMVNVLRIHVNQGSVVWPRGGAGRMGATGAILVALVVASVYSGSITAFLAIPFRSAPLDSVEDLVRSEVRPALRSRTLVLQTLTGVGGALAGVRQRVGVFTGDHTSSSWFFSQVADGTYALVDVYSSAVGRANRFERRRDNCKFYLGRTPVKVDLDVMAFVKNSPILQQVDHVILRLRHHGIIQHIKHTFYSVACQAQVTSRGTRPLNLLKVQGALYLLVTGLLVSTLCYLAERLCCHRFNSSSSTTVSTPPPHTPQL
ncbi:glutamate receptor 2-like [Panulirus ornatus]|uniref:glutamate receptor 2-like n=1 Tax=Panulirus ornatus TaxID=150431 RepID=UPI003A8C242A